ncbi:uncharacterized protein LOC130824796 [Amaranthus tricolor]|uniref:uncharacterized protein LOC130824796 n=1 Tax=Amaranthus tricolor TaxID=29722 RepID=UPI00258ADFF0|nr:uncharacterized protein LOC130824796 [Amaranthus tricolor]
MGSSNPKRIAEVAGGVTADCATVWCCFPYTAANLLTLVMFKMPKRLCRKALKRHRRRELAKKGLFPLHHDPTNIVSEEYKFKWGIPELERTIKIIREGQEVTFLIGGSKIMDEDLVRLENEMASKFTGFWRTHSQRET